MHLLVKWESDYHCYVRYIILFTDLHGLYSADLHFQVFISDPIFTLDFLWDNNLI